MVKDLPTHGMGGDAPTIVFWRDGFSAWFFRSKPPELNPQLDQRHVCKEEPLV